MKDYYPPDNTNTPFVFGWLGNFNVSSNNFLPPDSKHTFNYVGENKILINNDIGYYYVRGYNLIELRSETGDFNKYFSGYWRQNYENFVSTWQNIDGTKTFQVK
jgi:hypothetical protein